MPKKKTKNKNLSHDVTLKDSADAPKPVARVKKSTADVVELAWDQIEDEDIDIIEETNADGTKSIAYKKNRNKSKLDWEINSRPGMIYPEILWYCISHYIKPESIGTFARINKDTYAITKRKSFWRMIYKTYCQNSSKLPERLRIENSYKAYGLKQRVVRALYHTHEVFMKRIARLDLHDSRHHLLVKKRCINVWFCKGTSNWSIYFKFRKPLQLETRKSIDFIDELGSIDANPEEDSQVLQVICKSFHAVPPLMGMTLSSVKMTLSPRLRDHKVQLDFNSGVHSVSKDILPECSVTLDNVFTMFVYDWWHPKYPHFETKLPTNVLDDESVPVLKKDFFST